MSRLPDIQSTALRPVAAVPLAVLAGMLLAACAREPMAVPEGEVKHDGPAHQATVEGAAEASAAPSTASVGDTIGGDGSEIQLEALTARDIDQADLQGELACSFSADDAMPLLVAKGIVASDEPARGVVKVSGYVEPVYAPGGFNGITSDPTFTGQGKTIRIAVTGGAIGGGESPPRPATLTYQRADGASRVLQGRWQCGP